MSHTLLRGGLPRSNSEPPQGHQDARFPQDKRSFQDTRSNLAVQPAANAGIFKLKKNAVKIVSAAGPVSGAPLPKTPPRPEALTSSPTPVSSPTPCPVKAQQIAADRNKIPQVAKVGVNSTSLTPAPKYPALKIKSPSQTFSTKASLEDMFARLSTTSFIIPARPATEIPSVGLDKSMFSFEDRLGTNTVTTKGLDEENQTSPRRVADLKRPQGKLIRPQPKFEMERAQPSNASHEMSQDELEQEYLRKAAEYICTLPPGIDNSVNVIKTVLIKLRIPYAPDLTTLRSEGVEDLRARYSFAIVNYVNKKVNLKQNPLTADFVEATLSDSNGDLLKLCAALIENNYLALESLEQIKGLCKNILDVLPNVEDNPVMPPKTFGHDALQASLVTPTNPVVVSSKAASHGRVKGMRAWPTQEERENGAFYRTCVLKSVSGIKSLNELQALVWGGRLESIKMPETGSEHALVKFLTPEACQAYLDATKNGIEVQGSTNKTTVLVDRQPWPDSINDVIENCIKGDASRCIQATGAGNDWPDAALLKLARGKQQIKRDFDLIKQGKNASGHYYVEFRFGNIYHALNFKWFLMKDEDWEHCSIEYASDPCELACGVHYEDVDEGSGFSI